MSSIVIQDLSRQTTLDTQTMHATRGGCKPLPPHEYKIRKPLLRPVKPPVVLPIIRPVILPVNV